MDLPSFIVKATRGLLQLIGEIAIFVIMIFGALLIGWWIIFRKR